MEEEGILLNISSENKLLSNDQPVALSESLLALEDCFVLWQQLVHKVHRILLKFLWLDLVILIDINFSEYSVDILIGNWEVDLVSSEESLEEVPQLPPV